VTIRLGSTRFKCNKALAPFSAAATSYPANISNIPKLSRILGSSSITRLGAFDRFDMCVPERDRLNCISLSTMSRVRAPVWSIQNTSLEKDLPRSRDQD
jgi:hypothetical protein